jgi:hypothetical protein
MSVATLPRHQPPSAATIDQPYKATRMAQTPRSASKPQAASLIDSDVKHGDWRDELFRDGAFCRLCQVELVTQLSIPAARSRPALRRPSLPYERQLTAISFRL